MNAPRITVVGAAGGVGSALAHLLLTAPDPYELALIGRHPDSVSGLLMDAESLAPLGRTRLVTRGGAADLHDADVVVMAAAAPFVPRTARVEALDLNAEVVHPYFRELAKLPPDWPGHVIVVTNPVDVFAGWLCRCGRIDRRRVLGYAWNDTLRLRAAVARALDEDPADVTAWVVGEHGDAFVALFDRILVRGAPVRLPAAARARILAELRGFYTRWGRLGVTRTTEWTTAGGVARMIHDLVHGHPASWPASVGLDGEYGLRDVHVGVPVAVGARGLPEVVEWELAPDEYAVLHHAAALVRDRVAALGRL
ncbi:hypothetical protein [Streptomyces sp. NPDC090025]|uniref:lactate/malate family dehydrogenase n=1 Tax=Streptomyces sp. NPDC090025 TaxID=3365922 RepID=UPI003833E4B7